MNDRTDHDPNDNESEISETLDELSSRVETVRERLNPPEESGDTRRQKKAESSATDAREEAEAAEGEQTETVGDESPETEADSTADPFITADASGAANRADEDSTSRSSTAERVGSTTDDTTEAPRGDAAEQTSSGTERGSQESSAAAGSADAPVDNDESRADDGQQTDTETQSPPDTDDEADDASSAHRALTGSATPADDDRLSTTGEHSPVGADDIYTLLSTIERFIDTIRLFKTQIESVESRIDSQHGDIELLEDTSLNITDQLTELIDVMDTQDERLSAVEDELTEYNEVIGRYDREIETLQNGITDNRSTISSVRDNNLGLREGLADVRDELLESEQQIEQIRAQTQEIDDEVSALDSEDSRLRSEISDLRELNETLADQLADVESDVTSLENRTVEVDDEDLLLRAAIRNLDRRMISEDEVRSIAAEESKAQLDGVKTQLSDLQSVLEKIVSTRTTQADIVQSVESLKSDVTALMKEQGQAQNGGNARGQDIQVAEADQSELRQNVRELERENRAIKELIEGLENES